MLGFISRYEVIYLKEKPWNQSTVRESCVANASLMHRIERLLTYPTRSFIRSLSTVRTCSHNAVEGLSRPSQSLLSSFTWQGNRVFVAVVSGTTVTTLECVLHILLDTIMDGRRSFCSLPTPPAKLHHHISPRFTTLFTYVLSFLSSM